MQHLKPLVENRFQQEAPMPPPVGVPVRVPLRFQPTDLVIPKGGRLRLTVAGSVIVFQGLDQTQRGAGVLFRGPSQPSGSATRVTIHHDCVHPSTLRFVMPRARPDLLNVREKDEPAGQSLADNRPFAAPVSDAGGLATAPICGRGPADLPSAVSDRPSEASSCLARRSPIGRRNIGRVRLGSTRRRLLRLPVKPVRRTRRSYRYCVKGGSGRVSVVFSSRSARGRVRLVTTSARDHGNRRVRVRSSAARFRRAYPNRRRIGRGLYRAGPRSPRIFGLRRGRVRFIAVADRRLLRNRRLLPRYLRLAGVGR